MCSLYVVWHDRFKEFFFSPKDLWPTWMKRMRRFRELLTETDLESLVIIIEGEPCDEEYLRLVHDEDYIKFLKRSSELGYGLLDYGDTIAYEGVFEDTLLVAGSTLKALKLVMESKLRRAYQPFGGLHHAKREGAAGFCPVNDVAIAIEYARKKYGVNKIAVVDIDVHHGDGTQAIYYKDPNVLTISFHMRAPWFYPGTGDVAELGEGPGYGYSLNIPLPPGTADETYQWAFKEVVPRAILKYRPKLLIAQLGVDGHKDDLLGGLRLSTNTYRFVTLTLKELSKELNMPFLGLGGGGYGERSAEAMIACVVGLIDGIPKDITDRLDRAIGEEKTRDSSEIFLRVKEAVEEVLKVINSWRT
ncbi:MAG: acetoin utilization protein [Desulfurococcales archaeon ex4484_42]|nr:MAG: acetoin utilization protein [Desulfurococcales archaeon ex4484_42]